MNHRFDRISRYRLASFLLLTPLLGLVVDGGLRQYPPLLWFVYLTYFPGTALVVFSVFKDGMEIRRRKRGMERTIDHIIQHSRSDQKDQ